MATIKVLGGDIPPQAAHFNLTSITFKGSKPQPIRAMVESVEVVTEDNKVKLGAAAGWGTVGALLAGPIGLGVGALLGGRGRTVTFAARTRVGKQFVGQTDPKSFGTLLALTMGQNP